MRQSTAGNVLMFLYLKFLSNSMILLRYKIELYRNKMIFIFEKIKISRIIVENKVVLKIALYFILLLMFSVKKIGALQKPSKSFDKSKNE